MKRKLKGKCSTLTIYKDGNYDLESEYYNYKTKCQNKELQKQLNSSLVFMALADINSENTYSSLVSIIFKVLYTTKNGNDLKDLESLFERSISHLVSTLFKALYMVKNESDLIVIENFIDQVLGKNEAIDYLLKDFQEIVKTNGVDVLELKDQTKEDLINSIDRKRGR